MMRDPVLAFVKSTWRNMNIRCANGAYRMDTPRNKSYANVFIEMTRDAYRDWCLANRATIESLKRPSIDRIDSRLGYHIGNIQVIELVDNMRKDRTKFRNGMCVCFKCKGQKREDEFVRDSRRPNGRTTICRPCERARSHERNRRLGIVTGLGRWPARHTGR
jgi:hypothetical protein